MTVAHPAPKPQHEANMTQLNDSPVPLDFNADLTPVLNPPEGEEDTPSTTKTVKSEGSMGRKRKAAELEAQQRQEELAAQRGAEQRAFVEYQGQLAVLAAQ